MCHFAGILCESLLYYGTDKNPAICDIVANMPICRGFSQMYAICDNDPF